MGIHVRVVELPEPSLEFGGGVTHADPKAGLVAGGPYSLRYQSGQPPAVRLGFVGPTQMLPVATTWFREMEHRILSQKKNRQRYPDFPGFNAVFRTPLEMADRWVYELSPVALGTALVGSGPSRFRSIVQMYADGVATLAGREMPPNVVVCAISDEILDTCATLDAEGVARRRRAADPNQLALSLTFDGTPDREEELAHRTFRRALKARVMIRRPHVPIQIGTNHLFVDIPGGDDRATRAWSVAVGLYYKAGGIPWRLAEVPPHVCFVGLSFHKLVTTVKDVAYASLAEAFSTDIEGFVLRGEQVVRREDRQLHLSEEQARKLGRQILDEYRGRAGRLPVRVTLHKTTRFSPEERAGFRAAFDEVPATELLTLDEDSPYRLLPHSDYPPLRGTLGSINDATHFLYTTGYHPGWGTYPGPHVPAPLHLVFDGVEGRDLRRVSEETLGLTKMNWNAATIGGREPITLRMAKEVGPVMAEVGPDEEPERSYRYYM